MSNGSRKRQAARSVTRTTVAQPADRGYTNNAGYDQEYNQEFDEEFDEDYEEEYVEPPPRSQQRMAARQPAPPPRYKNSRPRSVQPAKRDYLPYIMGAVIGALLVGLMSLIYMLSISSRGSTAIVSPPVGSSGSGTLPTSPPASDAPRIPMADFRALYDNPATRPIIIDVRPKASYDEGHIKGAISFPETEVDARIAELPKDKLVIAYCA